MEQAEITSARGLTSTIKFVKGYAFKHFEGSKELTRVINKKVPKNPPTNEEKKAILQWNEVLILNNLKNSNIVAPCTSCYYIASNFYNKEQLFNDFIQNYKNFLVKPSCTELDLDLFTFPVMDIDSIIKNPAQISRNKNYLIVIVSQQLSGTIDKKLYSNIDITSKRNILIAILHKLNNLANKYNITHNDCQPANILYKQLDKPKEYKLDFYKSDGTIEYIPVRLDIKVYLTDFEWGYCNYNINNYTVIPYEYTIDDNKRPIVPHISIDFPMEPKEIYDELRGDPYGTYYRGFDVCKRSLNPSKIIDLTNENVYPRLFTIDTLMFVTELMKYGFDKEFLITLNTFFNKYVIISTNEYQGRHKGKIDYATVSAYSLTKML